MDSLFSILAGKNFDEPPEVAAIKKYVLETFQAEVSVKSTEQSLVISVPNAALASTLRMHGPELKRRCQIEKRLVFRIG